MDLKLSHEIDSGNYEQVRLVENFGDQMGFGNPSEAIDLGSNAAQL